MELSCHYILPRKIRDLPGMTLETMDVYEMLFSAMNMPVSQAISIEDIENYTKLSRQQIREAFKFMLSNDIALGQEKFINHILIKLEQ